MNHLVILLLATFTFQSTSAQSNKANDEVLIRAARKASNEAIKRNDKAGFAKYWWDEFIVVSGNGGATIGKDSATSRLNRQLNQTPGLTYVRTPNNILISDTDTLAFESGKWLGLKTKEQNSKWLGGKYSAMWWKRDGIWKLRSELFVTLKHY